MFSKLKNSFKKTDLEEQKFFQKRVLQFLKKNYQKFDIESHDDPQLLVWNENTLGLTNLYNDFLLTSQTNYDLETLAKEHFDKVFSMEKLILEKLGSFEQVKSSVFPQIMPIEYVKQFNALHIPFGTETVIGFVIDSEKAYRYITDDDFKNWEINIAEIKKAAIENLSEKSIDIDIVCVPNPNGMVIINTMDSFDAARILVPHLQEFILEKLGNPVYFGIPNREFLICWSKDSDEDFQETIKNQITNDFETRPYSLSKFTFELSEDGEIKQNGFEKSDNDQQSWLSNN